jgi:hypothetical protein
MRTTYNVFYLAFFSFLQHDIRIGQFHVVARHCLLYTDKKYLFSVYFFNEKNYNQCSFFQNKIVNSTKKVGTSVCQ